MDKEKYIQAVSLQDEIKKSENYQAFLLEKRNEMFAYAEESKFFIHFGNIEDEINKEIERLSKEIEEYNKLFNAL